MPLTDMVVAGMITDALADSEASITIVNPRPGAVRRTLKHLLGRNDFLITRTVKQAAAEYVDDTSRRLVDQLLESDELNLEAHLLVGWNPDLMSTVSRVRRTGPRLVQLRCDESPGTSATRPRETRTVTVGQLLDLAKSGDSLKVVFPESGPGAVVGLSFRRTATGATHSWQVLVPAGVQLEQR